MRRALLIVTVVACSAAPRAASAVDLQYGLGLYSQHTWRGITLTDDPVLQPEVRITHGKGLTLTTWASADLGEDNDNEWEVNEIRLTLEYAKVLPPFEVGFGFREYLFPNTPFPGTRELFLFMGYPARVTPRITVFYDIDVIEGFYGELALETERPLRGPWSLGVELAAGYADSHFAIGRQAGPHDVRAALHLQRGGKRSTWRFSGGWSDSLDRDVLFEQPVGIWAGVSVGRRF